MLLHFCMFPMICRRADAYSCRRLDTHGTFLATKLTPPTCGAGNPGNPGVGCQHQRIDVRTSKESMNWLETWRETMLLPQIKDFLWILPSTNSVNDRYACARINVLADMHMHMYTCLDRSEGTCMHACTWRTCVVRIRSVQKGIWFDNQPPCTLYMYRMYNTLHTVLITYNQCSSNSKLL
jgi:hypothetical protein